MSRSSMSIAQGRVFGFRSIRKVPVNICLKVNTSEDTDILRIVIADE
jgi:hypothetical protein